MYTYVNARYVKWAEQWDPVKGGGCISDVSFSRNSVNGY